MQTNLRDAFRGQSRSLKTVPFHMLGKFPISVNSNFVPQNEPFLRY